MVPLDWSDQYSTGVGFIDDSHQRIFQLINALEQPGRRGDDPGPEASLAVFLDYAGRHFEEEEELMRYLEYPGYEAHRMDHGRAVAWVRVLKAQSDEGMLEPTAIAAFAGEWVREHIQNQDLPFIQWIREPASVKALERLVGRKRPKGPAGE